MQLDGGEEGVQGVQGVHPEESLIISLTSFPRSTADKTILVIREAIT